jgi:hypothetical protein
MQADTNAKKRKFVGKPKRRERNALVAKKKSDAKTMSSNGFETLKVARGDPRMGNNSKILPVSNTSQKSLAQQCLIGSTSCLGFAIGFVTRALEKGYATFASSVNNPALAWYYTNYVLLQFAKGAVPAVQNLPFCLLAFGRAISQKTVGLAHGKITYSFDTASSISPSTTTFVYTGGSAAWTIGYVPPSSSATYVDGFPVITNGAIVVPEDNGATAFNEMCNFLETKLGKNSPFRMVAISTKTPLDRDVSSYAVISTQVGSGFAGTGTGGVVGLANLEVPIFRPFLSTFGGALQNSILNQSRWGNLVSDVSGDALYMGAMIGCGNAKWNCKRNPKFSFVDFGLLMDTLSKWVLGIQTAACNDPTGQWVGSGLSPWQNNYQCPLSYQEVQFLLRNTLMQAFKKTQAAVQGIAPIAPEINGLGFTPFTAGIGTCFLDTVTWKMPRLLAENIKALVSRTAVHNKKDLEFFEPVLGISSKNALNASNYEYSWTGSGQTGNTSGSLPSFAVLTSNFKRTKVDAKGLKTVTVAPEIPVSVIDGSCILTSVLSYVAINNPSRLQALASLWNEWLSQFGLSNYSCSLVDFSTDPGVNILYSSILNRCVSYGDVDLGTLPSSVKEDPRDFNKHVKNYSNKKSETAEIDLRMERKLKSVGNPFYEAIPVVSDVCQSDFLEAPYEQIQKFWVVPTYPIYSVNVGSAPVIQQIQAFMKQPFLQNSSSGFDGVTLDSQTTTYAQKMLKGRQDNLSDADRFLDEMDKIGKAGILSSLVGGALGALFPSAKGIIDTVADIVPF